MANPYRVIEEKTWARAAHCAYYRNCAQPTYSLTFEADITSFKRRVKEQGISLTMAMVYAVCSRANRIEAFRYRFLDGRVVLYDRIDTAFTYLDPGTELFKVVSVPLADDMREYAQAAARAAREQKEFRIGPPRPDVFQCSCMPWVSYTHVSHIHSGDREDATPLFDWGKYCEKDGRTVIPVSVQVHHAFVDGLHVGRFVEELQRFFDES